MSGRHLRRLRNPQLSIETATFAMMRIIATTTVARHVHRQSIAKRGVHLAWNACPRAFDSGVLSGNRLAVTMDRAAKCAPPVTPRSMNQPTATVLITFTYSSSCRRVLHPLVP